MELVTSNLSKYTSKNLFKKFLISQFFSRLAQLFSLASPKTVLDAGCGEGFVIEYLHKRFPLVTFHGVDKNPQALEFARSFVPTAQFISGDIFHLPYPKDTFDLVLCSEVLEHLSDPATALSELSRVSKEYLLLTVPNEPWFSLATFFSGQYLTSLGKHPEHVQFWNKASFVSLIKQNFALISVLTSFPWMLVLCRKK